MGRGRGGGGCGLKEVPTVARNDSMRKKAENSRQRTERDGKEDPNEDEGMGEV